MRLVAKAVLIGALLAWVAGETYAQADLIVKLRADGADSLAGQLDRVSKGALPTRGRLFDEVMRVAPVFGLRETVGKGSMSSYYVLTVPDSLSLGRVSEKWRQSKDVEWVITNHRYSLEVLDEDYNDTHFDSLGHLESIRAIEAWSITTGSADVRIGIIDTGVLFGHPDLIGQFAVNAAEDRNGNGILDAADLDGIDDDGNGYADDVIGYDFVDRSASVDIGDYQVRDPNASEDRLSPASPGRLGFGHGTLVTGIASAALNNGKGIAGVASGSRVVPLRAFGIDGLGDDDDVAAAVVYAAEQGIDVVNLSFGDTYYSPLMADAIRYATALGTTVVASGGNTGTAAPHYPSDYPEVIGVVWLDGSGDRRGSRASYGVGIDVGAPGSFVYTTTLPIPDDRALSELPDSLLYGYRSGSSVSAPQVSGVVALLRSIDPDLSPASIKAILTSTATDIESPGWDHETAAGRVDAAAALGLPFPAAVTITEPAHESGFQGGTLPIRGTVLNPLFEEYSVWFAAEATNEDPEWTLIEGAVRQQAKDEVLANWNATALSDGAYLLRLEVRLKDGRTVEDRRRIHLDRTPPSVRVAVSDAALILGRIGIQAEIESDDMCSAELVVDFGGKQFVRSSDRVGLRHSRTLRWIDESGRGGSAEYFIRVTNVAGLTTETDRLTVTIPPQPRPGYVEETVSNIPAGFILNKPADLDADGIPEVVINRYKDGWLGDTVWALEWAGDDFQPSLEVIANSFPRDVGDSDGDGNPELLLQVSAVAQVIEFQNGAQSAQLVFIDTAGVRNPSADSAAWGALLGDLDGDGRGEVIVHNRKTWRSFEWDGSEYKETATIANPTPLAEANQELLGSEANGFAEPEAVLTDLDGNGFNDFVVTDADGDFIVYEATADNVVEPKWFYQTPRFNNQGSRMTSGDFDGDGLREFVGFVHSWPVARLDGEYEAPLGIYYRFEVDPEQQFVLIDSIVVSENFSNHGALNAVDLDGDDADELVIAHPPNLYVVHFDANGRWSVLYGRDAIATRFGSDAIRSIGLVSGDFDLNGTPEFIAAGSDQRLHRFEWSSLGTRSPPPRWVSSVALDANTVSLAWTSDADSTAVYRSANLGAFNLIGVVADDSFVDSISEPVRYRLRARYAAEASPLSEIRAVRPHAPGVVTSVSWIKDQLRVGFSERIAETTSVSDFRLGDGSRPEAALLVEGGRSLAFRFGVQPSASDTLFWNGLTDAEGTPFASVYTPIPPRAGSLTELVLSSWQAVADDEALLVFNLPLDPAIASDAGNYEVTPSGHIVAAVFDAAQPNEIQLKLGGRSLGPTGLKTTIIVTGLRAADGTNLGSEGTVATFAAAAESTQEAYVFPNPYRAAEHPPRVMIAGLPRNARIAIFSALGEPIRTLVESDGDGGVPWDTRDMHGDLVPSGIYIVLVESEGQETVSIKAAVLR